MQFVVVGVDKVGEEETATLATRLYRTKRRGSAAECHKRASQLGAVVMAVVLEDVGEVLEQPEEDNVHEACNDIVMDGVADVVEEDDVDVVEDVVTAMKM